MLRNHRSDQTMWELNLNGSLRAQTGMVFTISIDALVKYLIVKKKCKNKSLNNILKTNILKRSECFFLKTKQKQTFFFKPIPSDGFAFRTKSTQQWCDQRHHCFHTKSNVKNTGVFHKYSIISNVVWVRCQSSRNLCGADDVHYQSTVWRASVISECRFMLRAPEWIAGADMTISSLKAFFFGFVCKSWYPHKREKPIGLIEVQPHPSHGDITTDDPSAKIKTNVHH